MSQVAAPLSTPSKWQRDIFPLHRFMQKRNLKRTLSFINELADCRGVDAPAGGKRSGKAVDLPTSG